MLPEFEALDERTRSRVSQAINRLLREQFVHIDDHGSASIIETLRSGRVRRFLESYFDVAGYRFVVNDADGWAGLMPDVSRVRPPTMLIGETLVLLLLRRIWEEAVQVGELQPRSCVLITVNEAYAAYEDTLRTRRAALLISDFHNVLKALERRAIIHLGPYDSEAQDYELTIRPIVTLLAGDDFMAALEPLLHRADLSEPDHEAEQREEDTAS